MISRFQFGSAGSDGRDRGFWTVVLLLLPAVLIPTACLLYFLNEAIVSQRTLARRRLVDAYVGQVRSIVEQASVFWEKRLADLDAASATGSPSVVFERCVRQGLADSVICLNPDGSPGYPSLAAVPEADRTATDARWGEARSLEDGRKLVTAAQKYAAIADSAANSSEGRSLAARAAQASIRCWLAAGEKSAALRASDNYFASAQLLDATGLDGRVIALDEYRLNLDLVPQSDPGYTHRVRLLHDTLADYAHPIPAAQRLFLIDQLRALSLPKPLTALSTYQAERMAEHVLSDGQDSPEDSAVRFAGCSDTWKFTSSNKRLIALYSTNTVMASVEQFTGDRGSEGDAVFDVSTPLRRRGVQDSGITLGARLPGWRVAVNTGGLLSSGRTVDSNVAAYTWIGFLTIATVSVFAILGAQLLRRQMAIAHLKTDLVAAVSHELKTPLASMKLLVESLLGNEQFEPARTRQYLEMVARENNRLSRLIDNFLTFSRMERNRSRFDFVRTRPEAVARAAVESIGERYAVALDIEPGLPLLYADENALVTVLLNLLDNAYKYSHDDRRIELRVSAVADKILFAVKDNGIGIAERNHKMIFRRFYQVDRSLARQAGGVGLGLSIVEFIVRAHGGTVSVASRLGAGSTFTVALPRSFYPTGSPTGEVQ